MLTVISPAKRLDWTERNVPATDPAYQDDAVSLARTARRLSKPKLAALMDLSNDLAKLNKARFESFSEAPESELTRPAVFAFAGDTYQGLEAASLDSDALRYAQDHLRILSGLYGLLRPMDAIQPYRLEMGSALATRRGRNLYAYWGDRLAKDLNQLAKTQGAGILLNCASQEYFGAVDRKALKLSVITPQFLEDKPGGPKIVSFFAKKARGAMARFVVENRINSTEDLLGFTTGGYVYAPDLSQPDRPAFLRAEAERIAS